MTERQREKRNRIIRIAAIVSTILVVAAAVVLALLGHQLLGVYSISALLAVYGISRVIFRDQRVWFAARAWWFDTLVYFLLAAAIFVLAPYINVP
ncbi:MAG: DUF3017 domain-containing protein [Varibaculum sp.]|nr:DUF3017 domain-containing protein [Varibaculum sp.]